MYPNNLKIHRRHSTNKQNQDFRVSFSCGKQQVTAFLFLVKSVIQIGFYRKNFLVVNTVLRLF